MQFYVCWTWNRVQTARLLQKFHKNGLFEDVRGIKYDIEDFTDSNSRLFRYHDSGMLTNLLLKIYLGCRRLHSKLPPTTFGM